MIDIPKYQIPKFQVLSKEYDFKQKTDVKYASYIACMYYEFAYYQMLDFCSTTNKFFEEALPEDSPLIDTYLYKSWSHAYSMYALLRTTIEAVRKVNKEFLSDAEVGDFYKEKIKEIVDIANDVVKHPMFNNNGVIDASYAYRPSALYRWDEIEIQQWSDQTTPSSSLTIAPEKDFYMIQNYLEHIADLFSAKKFQS